MIFLVISIELREVVRLREVSLGVRARIVDEVVSKLRRINKNLYEANALLASRSSRSYL